MEELNLTELRNKCLKSLYSCTENIVKYLDEDSKRDEKIDKLRNCVVEYCKLEQYEEAGKKTITSFKAEPDCTEWNSLKNQFQTKMSLLSKKNAKFDKHPAMKEFEKHRRKAGSEQEQNLGSDLAITETIETYIDPVTKKTITNPVRNKICNHVYDKETADNIVNNEKNKGCPCFGCINKQPMRVEHLEADADLLHTILSTQRTEQMEEDGDDPLAQL